MCVIHGDFDTLILKVGGELWPWQLCKVDVPCVISIALKHSVLLSSAVGTVLALKHWLENIPAERLT